MADQKVATETPQNDSVDSESAPFDTETETAVSEEVAVPFVGQWNLLISTSNWEKGDIICQWREAMTLDGVPVTDYSDEAWAQLVGGVTSQHVGRLRRAFQRFGNSFKQYEGLYWSHFQAVLDWEDAEMWLEGSLQNNWSVSQMRGKRWETLGTSPEDQQAAATKVADEEAVEAEAVDSQVTVAERETAAAVKPGGDEAGGELPAAKPQAASGDSDPAAEATPKRTRLSVEVESLPDDMAEAFESFKLAIIAHRREGWRDTTPESVVECLDSLKELALAEES